MWVSIPLLRVGTDQDPSPMAAMSEHEAMFVALGTVEEPSALTKKQVPLVTTPGTMQVPSLSRTEQER